MSTSGATPRPGEVLGKRYRLEAEIAEGGMGKVFAATDSRSGRKVAVKLLTSTARDVVARFERELQVSKKVKHPRCVAVLDHGRLPTGPFMVMEWLDGRSLWEVVRDDGPLPLPRAAKLCADLVEALAVAHAHGVVHRDVKPENVMVVGRGADERAKLVDFGIARFMNEPAQRVTQIGQVVGSVEYMSPEQLRGEDAAAQSDLYAAAGVLHFLLTGKPPYGSGDPAAIARSHLSAPTPNLGGEAARVQPLLDRALAKNPAQRFRSAAQMHAALRRVAPGEIAKLRKRGNARAMWAALALAALAALAAAAWAASAQLF